jgi:outer membrane protein
MKLIAKRLVFLWALLLLATPVAAQPVKIGFIDASRIEHESKRPKQDAEKLKQEFAAREATVRDLHAKVTAMQKELENIKPDAPAEEINGKRRDLAILAQQFEQVRRDFVEDLERRKSEERRKFLRDLTAIASKIAKAQGLDLVVQEAVYANQALDITDQVLKALDQAESAATPN